MYGSVIQVSQHHISHITAIYGTALFLRLPEFVHCSIIPFHSFDKSIPPYVLLVERIIAAWRQQTHDIIKSTSTWRLTWLTRFVPFVFIPLVISYGSLDDDVDFVFAVCMLSLVCLCWCQGRCGPSWPMPLHGVNEIKWQQSSFLVQLDRGMIPYGWLVSCTCTQNLHTHLMILSS